MRSHKELSLDNKIIETLTALDCKGTALTGAKLLLADEETRAAQEYANTVSIVRLGYNDHGPVHMRTVVMNTVIMAGLLRKAGIKTNLEKEECGDFEDSLLAMILAGMFHDLGMGVGRQEHELHSVYMAYPIIDRVLAAVYPDNLQKRVIIRTVALEGIAGHMGSRTIHSLEAGVIQVADGCDMTKGRARITTALNQRPRQGDIHQYSANSIEEVKIDAGEERPIRISISMSSEVGLFQVEEVLLTKIAASTAKTYVEIYALVDNSPPRRYTL